MDDGDERTKQLKMLFGKPVIIHTLSAFEKCKYIDEIVIVARKEEIDEIKGLVSEYGIKKVSCVVEGGSERSESAFLGLKGVSRKAEYVAIHDVARCLITPEAISDVVSAAYAYRAASAGCRVKDTVKRVNSNGFIIDTPKRDELWLAQTPQVFSYQPIKEAYEKLLASEEDLMQKGISVTDDAMVMETFGTLPVKLVTGSYRNIKITTPEDLKIAEAFLNAPSEK
jgi:2-C-methyl-D-erythritol 4-phosphate cytidylyltransferase